MSTIVLRSVKNAPLTNAEVDANFSNLNTDKTELGGTYSSGTANGVLFLSSSKVLTTGSALTFDGTNLGLGVTASAVTHGPHLEVGSNRGTVSIGTGYIEDNGTTQFFNGVRPLAFGISGTEGMRLTSTGLGIGTSSPGVKLDVAGTARVQSSFFVYGSGDRLNVFPQAAGSGVNLLFTNNANSAYAPVNIDASLQSFNISGGEQMRLTSTGLGIGTSSPGVKLQVGNGSGLQQALISGGGYDLVLGASGGGIFGFASQNISTVFSTSAVPLGIGTSAAQPLILGTSGSERMRLDSSGNLGIGTSSPSRRLTVASETAGLPTLGTGSGGLFLASNNGLYGLFGGVNGSNGDTWLQAMRNDAATPYNIILNPVGGNLGLGVTPSAWGSPYTGSFQMKEGGFLANNQINDVHFGVNAFHNGTNWRYIGSNSASRYEQFNGGHFWFTAPSGTAGNAISFTQAMTLDASGNLGVGTTTPSNRLNVVSTSTDIVRFDSTSASNYGEILIRSNGGAGNNTRGRVVGGFDAGGSGFGGFLAFNTTTTQNVDTERARIDSSGRFMVGTTSPVSSGITVTGGYWSRSADLGTVGGVAPSNGGIVDVSSFNGSGGVITFTTANTGGSNTERARIDSGGNLLVGTTSNPATGRIGIQIGSSSDIGLAIKALNNGNWAAGFYNSSGTNVGSIVINSSATAYNTTSDYRLKTVIGPVADAGQRIDALQPVEYTWNASGERTRGFLAHQFQEVYAGSVSGTKDAVDAEGKPVYQSMQASTSEVIADLVAEIKSLRQRLAAAGI